MNKLSVRLKTSKNQLLHHSHRENLASLGALQGPSQPRVLVWNLDWASSLTPRRRRCLPLSLASRRTAGPVDGGKFVGSRATLSRVSVLPLWPRLTLPFALPLHHDVPVQSPGHSVGKLGALQECGHDAVGDAWAVGTRLSLTARPQAGPCRRFLRGLRRALASTSYPAARINPSGVTTANGTADWRKGKAEALRDGCRDVQTPCGFTERPGMIKPLELFTREAAGDRGGGRCSEDSIYWLLRNQSQ